MRWKLVLPELGAYFSDLVASLLADRICGEQVPVVPVVEHFQGFKRRLPEQPDGRKIFLVCPRDGRRRLKRLDPLLGSSKGCQRGLDPNLQIRLPNVIDLVEDPSQTKADGASLDVSVDWPQGLDIRLLGAVEGGLWRRGDRPDRGYGFATRRGRFACRGNGQNPKKGQYGNCKQAALESERPSQTGQHVSRATRAAFARALSGSCRFSLHPFPRLPSGG